MVQFSPFFMTPGTWNFTKIKCFNFLQFSWNFTKIKCFIFSNFHETSLKSNASIFSNFYDPGYMKLQKNLMLQFSLIFMTLGTWNFTKIKCFNFLQFSWPRVHETSKKSNALIFSGIHDPGYTKLQKNQTLQFSPIFMKLH